MSPLILRTRPDDPLDYDLAEIGRLSGNGRGGVVIDERATAQMQELQKPDGTPLSGKKLKAAVQDFANRRGFVLQDSDKTTANELRAEVGIPVGPSLQSAVDQELARREREREAQTLTLPENLDDVEELEEALTDPGAGAVKDPPEQDNQAEGAPSEAKSSRASQKK